MRFLTTEFEKKAPKKNRKPKVEIDPGIENFAYLSDGSRRKNPRNLRSTEERLALAQSRMSNKQKVSSNRVKVQKSGSFAYENSRTRERISCIKQAGIL